MTARALTLIESLVVIVIIAVLTAIALPLVMSLRRSAATITDASNMRQSMVDFYAYASSNRGVIANAGTPYDPRSKFYYRDSWGTEPGWFRYRAQNGEWPSVLAQQIEPSRHWYAADEDFLPDEAAPPGFYDDAPSFVVTPALLAGYVSTFRLGDTLRLDARGFGFPRATADPRLAVRELATDVRFSDVRFASTKGILMQKRWWGDEKGLHNVAFADASVSLRSLTDALPTATHPTSTVMERRGEPVNCTLDGFLGTDW